MSRPFYLTTAIDYANGAPHLGHAYEKILSDVIVRFRRLMGHEAYFLTGTDEHGQKVQQSARKEGIEPKEFVDRTSQLFRDLCAKLLVSNDDFIRTTEPRHMSVVRRLLQHLWDAGEIYRADYVGFYSARQEQFLQDKDRNPDGSWPEIYGEVTQITETNYFFRLARHQDWLVEHLRSNEDFIFPRFRAKQVLEFLKEPLNDLCISRPRERLAWGIPLPFDEAYVTYVWFDALVNYYSAVAERPGLWPATFHVIGKDILVPPHAVYWPIMLHACGLALPEHLLVHGWWLRSGQKLSKSTGEVVDPLALVDQFGPDAFRYFLMREMNVGQDSEFSLDLFFARYNSDLANDLGNLVNRTLNMTSRYCGAVPRAGVLEALDVEVRADWERTRTEVLRLFEEFQFHTGLDRTLGFIKSINRYAEQRAPWKLAKGTSPADRSALENTLATMAEALRLATTLLEPVMPGTAARVAALLGAEADGPWPERLVWSDALAGRRPGEAAILFPKPVSPEGKG